MTEAERAEAVEVMAKSTSATNCSGVAVPCRYVDGDCFCWNDAEKSYDALLAAGFVVKKENADG